MNREKLESVKLELDQTKNKKKLFYFFMGFLITQGVLIILTIISFNIWESISYKDSNTLYIGYSSSLVVLGIVTIVIGGYIRNKNPYISMGMIVAIFGLAFLIIKRNGEQLVDPYTEHPKKKKSHFFIGFLLSIGWGILYSPTILSGILLMNTFDEILEIFLVLNGLIFIIVYIIIELNIFIGVLKFFFKEKLRYISMGMILSFPMGSFLILLFGIIRWG